MDITFSAANTVGLNNPGTEIITLVKDGSGNFINPPSYDKMRAYLRSGEVPMLFVTAEGGETGSLYQLDEYSETENKIRFSNSANTIEFSAGSDVPNVIETAGGFEYDFIIKESSDGDTLIKGTYASILAKLGTMPINGAVIINLGDNGQKSNYNQVVVEYVNNKLKVYTMYSPDGTTLTSGAFVINADNTVTVVE